MGAKSKRKAKRAGNKRRQQSKQCFSQATDPIEFIKQGVKFHRAGSLTQAEHCYRQALAAEPNNADANHLLGVAAYQAGKLDIAAELIGKAVRLNPNIAEAQNNLGTVHKDLGQLDLAIACYRKTIALRHDFADAHYNLGSTYQALGQAEKAIASYRKALQIKPNYAEAHYNLGVIFSELGQLDEAVTSYKKALTVKPDYAAAHNNLGDLLAKSGHRNEAVISFKKALAIEPKLAAVHYNLGSVLTDLGQPEKAVSCFLNALTLQPDFAEAYNNMGKALTELGRLEEAAVSLKKALAIRPDYLDVHNNLGFVFQQSGMLDEAELAYRQALSINPDYMGAYSNLLLIQNYRTSNTSETLFKAHQEWGNKIGATKTFMSVRKTPERAGSDRLRVAYVSPDFKAHSVSNFFEPLLKAHDREVIEVYCYSNTLRTDKVTERLQQEAEHWRSIVGLPDGEVIKLIEQDNIDILVDLAGHTDRNSLSVFAHKPAPVQVTWLGYPNTTGLSAMDYRFTDDIADPVGEADRFHTEQLIRLPDGFLCYQGDDSVAESTTLPCSEQNHITFGSFNNITKVTPQVVKVWSEILQGLPDSQLLLKSKQLADGGTRSRFLGLFEKAGISPERVIYYAALPKKADHLALYSQVDIGLDPFPYNGTTTTCEALWMGVPTITLAGDRHASRVGASIMSHVDLEEFIASDTASYVALALKLAQDRGHLAAIRQGLRERMRASPLCNARLFARNLEAAYKRMWDRYRDEC